MQRRHRKRHLRLWILIGVVVGAGFFAGLALRQERPVETQTIGSLLPETGGRIA
ncbi:MAG: hypothetical protein RIM72_06215 [Alphaproteobacteria bacterium]